ncbi:MoaD/ThiS family protein [Natranaerobius thermophilus]|uniref:ThiamineS protein n=1 Tax=Natranaerobius thermophilus (strain ATCC BAA-1301 / DSM 18059 / JW/NM-WN-LF) TaxID=457570 RepID=B2A5R8_NATTJ|nr:MoaD/ThiS family protein [Natranaerobius thermophilus]ACB84011.1 thiamineS protein [Natranaerobius thermophilus JW/NM-WN-LF]
MKVTLKGTNQVTELSGNKKVSNILSELELNPETVIVVKEGQILTHDKIVKDHENIEIISVVSGG